MTHYFRVVFLVESHKFVFLKIAIILLPFVESIFVSMVTENMVRGLDDEESSFLDEVSRQQSLVEKQRRDEEKQELLEYRISFYIAFVYIITL